MILGRSFQSDVITGECRSAQWALSFLVFPICLSLLLVGSGSRLTPHAWSEVIHMMTCGGWIPHRGNIPKDLCTSLPFVIPLWQQGVLGSLTFAESSGSLTCTGCSPFLSFSIILAPTFCTFLASSILCNIISISHVTYSCSVAMLTWLNSYRRACVKHRLMSNWDCLPKHFKYYQKEKIFKQVTDAHSLFSLFMSIFRSISSEYSSFFSQQESCCFPFSPSSFLIGPTWGLIRWLVMSTLQMKNINYSDLWDWSNCPNGILLSHWHLSSKSCKTTRFQTPSSVTIPSENFLLVGYKKDSVRKGERWLF